MLPDRKGEKLMRKFRKHIKYDDIITGEIHYNGMHKKSVCGVYHTDGKTGQQTANIIYENVLSQAEY